MSMSPGLLIEIIRYAALISAGLFLYQTLINLILLKKSIRNKKLIRYHIGLCGASMFYALVMFALTLPINLEAKYILLHLCWVAGSLVTFFYISAMKILLNVQGRSLEIMKKLTLISCGGAVFSLIVWTFFKWMLFADSSKPHIEYNNIVMNYLGGFNHGFYVKILSLFVIIPSVYALVYFLNHIRKTGQKQKILVIGILVSLLSILNDLTINFF